MKPDGPETGLRRGDDGVTNIGFLMIFVAQEENLFDSSHCGTVESDK